MGSHPRAQPSALHPESDETCQKGRPAGGRLAQVGKDLRLVQGLPRAAGKALTGKWATTQPPGHPQGLGEDSDAVCPQDGCK